MLKSDGVVAVTVFEKQHGSLFQRLHEVLDTLVPGEFTPPLFSTPVHVDCCVYLYPERLGVVTFVFDV